MIRVVRAFDLWSQEAAVVVDRDTISGHQNQLPSPHTHTHTHAFAFSSSPPCLFGSSYRPLARSLTRSFVRLLLSLSLSPSLWFCKQLHANVMNARTPLRLFIPSPDATARDGGGGADIVFAPSSPNTIWHQGVGAKSGEKRKGVGRRDRHRTAHRSMKGVDDASPKWSSLGTNSKRCGLPEF
ncbi:hypothetical protein TcWFU_006135 [Taenia crassiceps]|uniref:Uncharacterized protein n=1 Tax=Taenia crassiceps TaxID=6207 RepID=A0ABR4Q9D6_9CEST